MAIYTKEVHLGFVTTNNTSTVNLRRRKPIITNMKNLKTKRFEPYNSETDIVMLDIERMDKSINSTRYKLPRGLSREEKRQHILNNARDK